MFLAVILSTEKLVPLSSNLQRNYLLKKDPLDSAVNKSTILNMELSTNVLRDGVDVEIQSGKLMLASNIVVFLLFTKNFS